MVDTIAELRSLLEGTKQGGQEEKFAHIAALLARFDACVRGFRAISPHPECCSDAIPSRNASSAPQVAVPGPQHQQQQAGKNATINQRKPKVQQQQNSSDSGTSHATPYKRHSSTSELLCEESTAGSKGANSRNSTSSQLSVRVIHLQVYILVCVHSALFGRACVRAHVHAHLHSASWTHQSCLSCAYIVLHRCFICSACL